MSGGGGERLRSTSQTHLHRPERVQASCSCLGQWSLTPSCGPVPPPGTFAIEKQQIASIFFCFVFFVNWPDSLRYICHDSVSVT